MFDIRNAKRPAGVVPPQTVASEKQEKKIPDIDASGNVAAKYADEYDGDVVIAGYMEYLKKNDITNEDIQNVLDALLSSGDVQWSFKLFDSIPVVFTVRQSWVDDYIVEILDKMAAESARVSNVRYNNTVAECNLAASLTQLKDETYTIATREDLAEARKRIQKMPYVIQNALVKKLAVFDRTIAVATSDWAVKNFMKPRQEK
jgi:hypothetical protein